MKRARESKEKKDSSLHSNYNQMKKMTGVDKRLVHSRLEAWILSSDSSGLLCVVETSDFLPILANFQ